MFSRVRASWSVVFIVVTVALNALPVAARSANTTVTISVSPVQQVEGSTSLIVSAGGPLQQGRLVVKSNTAWEITSGTIWQRLGAATPVLTGLKGVHQVEYEVQLDGHTAQPGLPITVTFSVEPTAAH